MLKLLSWLKKPQNTKKSFDDSPVLRCLASLVTYYVTGNRTAMAVNIGVLVYGMTRSKELIEIIHKLGLSPSYKDVLLLYDTWALKDIEASACCPQEIADCIPSIVIVDNDDFKIDTMTGNATGAHRTNVMLVQPEKYEKVGRKQVQLNVMKKKEVSTKLKEKSSELTSVQQYVCSPGSSSEPPARPRTQPPINGTIPQRSRSDIHVLARADDKGKRPPPDKQTVPAYSGIQSCLLSPLEKSKPYYHTTYNEPPKKSVVHDVMTKLVNTMVEKEIPFSFLVGDLPTYKLIVVLKAESPSRFNDIIPTIGAFHPPSISKCAIYMLCTKVSWVLGYQIYWLHFA